MALLYQRAIGGMLEHLVKGGVAKALCGYQPAQRWHPGEQTKTSYRRTCDQCSQRAGKLGEAMLKANPVPAPIDMRDFQQQPVSDLRGPFTHPGTLEGIVDVQSCDGQTASRLLRAGKGWELLGVYPHWRGIPQKDGQPFHVLKTVTYAVGRREG